MTQPASAASASRDPLLQPFRLKHLALKNRVISTCHEPAYSEDGLPKERYRLYHVEKAKGGCAMTMIGGSATVDDAYLRESSDPVEVRAGLVGRAA